MGLCPAIFTMQNLSDLQRLANSLAVTDKMPALFLGHGSPMNAIEENQFTKSFREVAKSIQPAPRAIICVSAHWFTKGTRVTAVNMPKTIHDFYGFPQELFKVQYPAPGHPALAQETAQLLGDYHATLDHEWGLDHGAWSVIKHMYPEANIPVLQLSIDSTKPAPYHYELATRLKALRHKGILIIGSGNIVHNLRMIDWANMNKDDYGYDWAAEVRTAVNRCILDHDYQPLLNYHRQGSAWANAIPTPDHFLPLIYTLGMQDKGEAPSLFNDKLLGGSISMTSVLVH